MGTEKESGFTNPEVRQAIENLQSVIKATNGKYAAIVAIAEVNNESDDDMEITNQQWIGGRSIVCTSIVEAMLENENFMVHLTRVAMSRSSNK